MFLISLGISFNKKVHIFIWDIFNYHSQQKTSITYRHWHRTPKNRNVINTHIVTQPLLGDTTDKWITPADSDVVIKFQRFHHYATGINIVLNNCRTSYWEI